MPAGKPTSYRSVTASRKGDVVNFWQQLKPQLASALAQTWQRLARYSDVAETDHREPLRSPAAHSPLPMPDRAAPAHEGERDRRRQPRIDVKMVSQFSSTTSIIAGEGQLRDFSPSGCRITSPVRVPLGAAVECWIYPQEGDPFVVDEARVRWVGHREFGLMFTKVRSGVHRHITDMCRRMAPL